MGQSKRWRRWRFVKLARNSTSQEATTLLQYFLVNNVLKRCGAEEEGTWEEEEGHEEEEEGGLED